ncbi:hypothetical protein L1049_011568 [Liquidambar formosana]|uniref:Uncharacterized protein n=1 Tax=Liquidambar formosana TaxID=63359 RepID=A0AAP0WX43_LIQFO
MEEYSDIHHQEEEAEDALSFCNFPINDVGEESEYNEFSGENPNPSSDQDLFEFFPNPKCSQTNNIIFCGKIIPYEHERRLENRAKSLRVTSSKPSPSPTTAPAIGSCRFLSTSAGSKSRRHVFMFGVVPKFRQEMELRDMKKRQSRLAPAPMFPAVGGGEMVVSGEAGIGKVDNGNWGLLRLLKCRSRTHFGSALATSFGCLSVM